MALCHEVEALALQFGRQVSRRCRRGKGPVRCFNVVFLLNLLEAIIEYVLVVTVHYRAQ